MTEQDRCKRLVSMITDLASKMSLDELKEAYDFLFDLQRDERDRASHTPITAVQSNTCNTSNPDKQSSGVTSVNQCCAEQYLQLLAGGEP